MWFLLFYQPPRSHAYRGPRDVRLSCLVGIRLVLYFCTRYITPRAHKNGRNNPLRGRLARPQVENNTEVSIEMIGPIDLAIEID